MQNIVYINKSDSDKSEFSDHEMELKVDEMPMEPSPIPIKNRMFRLIKGDDSQTPTITYSNPNVTRHLNQKLPKSDTQVYRRVTNQPRTLKKKYTKQPSPDDKKEIDFLMKFKNAGKLYIPPSPNIPSTPMQLTHPHNLHRNSSQLIDEHIQEIQFRINSHTTAALRFKKRDRMIGYPVTLFSSFIASTLMMNVSQDSNNNQKAVDIAGFSLSVVSFIMSLSRDYLKYGEKYQAHDVSSKLYTSLLRSVEVRLIEGDISTEERRDMFKDIIDQMSIIEQYELPIPGDISEEIRGEVYLPRSAVINQALYDDMV